MPLITTEYDTTVCQCCGASATSDVKCICTAYPEWHMTENGDVACGYHKPNLYIQPERKTVALGAPAAQTHDRWANFRNPNVEAG